MYDLKIIIVEDSDRYSTTKKGCPVKLGKLAFSGVYGLDEDALEGVCSAILALFPDDPVALRVSYDIGNH